jgi:hypothetical protein
MRNKAVLERIRDKLIAVGCTLPELGSTGEREATRRWNGALQPRPALVARCTTTAQVSTALRAAADATLPVSVHNGGPGLERALTSGRRPRNRSVPDESAVRKRDGPRRDHRRGG